MNLLVTGASGFLGRNLILRAPADWRIVALYNNDQSFVPFVRRLDRPNVVTFHCDLSDPAAVAELVRQHGSSWEACLYLAGKVAIPWSVKEPKADLLANTVPVINALEALTVEKLVYFSSGAVYDGLAGEVTPGMAVLPTLPYAISKLAAEHYVQFYSRRRGSVGQYLIVRFFGAYGPYEAAHKIYTRLIRTLALEGQRRYTIYGDGSNLIDAMAVQDAVEAISRMLTGNYWNATVNLSAGTPTTVEALVRTVAGALGLEDVEIEKQGAANERNEFWGSTHEMRDHFGFSPETSAQQGIRQFRDFLVAGDAA